jgi:Flp pilus assembly secretin CpaC
MSLSSLRTRARAAFGFRSLAIGVLLCPAAAFAEPPPEAVGVNIDQARLIKLPDRVATIVVGNPLIADVTLQPGGIVVVTGKGYGVTNLIAMERGGEVLVDRLIQVEGPADPIITVYRGVERQSLSCMPICQPRVTLGDADRFFKPAIDQAGTLSGQAYGSAGASGKPAN